MTMQPALLRPVQRRAAANWLPGHNLARRLEVVVLLREKQPLSRRAATTAKLEMAKNATADAAAAGKGRSAEATAVALARQATEVVAVSEATTHAAEGCFLARARSKCRAEIATADAAEAGEGRATEVTAVALARQAAEVVTATGATTHVAGEGSPGRARPNCRV